MAFFHWVGREAALANANYTVLAQAVNPNDDGVLLWDVFFPRQNVPSVKISLLTALLPKRYVSDRREWNARGRFIPQEFPGTSELEMVPIEDFFKLGEREIQAIEERFGSNQAAFSPADTTFLRQIGVDVESRLLTLVKSNYRRIELDCINAWTLGQVTARNPTTGATYTMSYGLDVNRYTTAAPVWTGGAGGTAYTKFIAWLLAGYDYGVQITGAMMRLSTREAIRTSAPNLASPGSGTPPVLADVEARIQDELGTDFRFYTNERTLDVFGNAGIQTTQTKVWPANTIAVVPAGETVGYSAFAPVARAGELARAVPEARIDRNGMAVFGESANNGRELTFEAQVNQFPVPDETRIWVTNAGV